MVAIKRTVDDGNPPRFFTGTLVSDQYVVTTANVVDNQAYNKEQFEVRPGATSHVPNNNDLMAWQKVAEIRSHPFYKHRKKPSNELSYNVGLLKLTTRVDFFHFLNGVGVGPICLPTPKQTNKEDLRVKRYRLQLMKSVQVGTEVLLLETNFARIASNRILVTQTTMWKQANLYLLKRIIGME